MSGSERRFDDFLGDMFLRDVGLAGGGDAPTPPSEDEFARVALELGLVDENALRAARAACAGGGARPKRLWQVLEESGALEVDDVLRVFRFSTDLASVSDRSIGRYYVIEPIGEGGSGRVYRAIHQDLFKHVALKVVAERPGMPASSIERFHREAATAARLVHPNLVGVHDVGVDGSLHFIAMDLVEGRTLGEWLGAGPSLERRVETLARVCRGVGHAHRSGVVHRDLKPQNVLVREDGQPVVVDFGLARLAEDVTLTQDGAVLGTPHYMAPEQVRGEVSALDARTDVFALGVVLYEAVFGALPFPGRTALEVYQRIQKGPPEYPGGADRTARALAEVTRRCLEPDPAMRYADAGALADDLERIARGESVETAWVRARRWRHARRTAARAAGVAAVVIAVALAASWARDMHGENRRLAYANDVKSALALSGPRLEPILARAERLRYVGASESERADVVRDLDAELTRAEDGHGVAAAYRAWVRWLLREPDAAGEIEAACDANPENPFPALVSAWRHLRTYADQAQWPGDGEFNMHSALGPQEDLAPRETPEMRATLEAALADLDRARGASIWRDVPELAWVEDLCEGYRSYAANDMERAIEHLERVGAYAHLALEPMLGLAFASARAGDLEGAFHWTRALLERRPELVAARRTLAACHEARGIATLRRHGDARADLEEARRLIESFSDDDTDGRRLHVEMVLLQARERVGERVTDEYLALAERFGRALEAMPDEPAHLANRAMCLARVVEARRDPDGSILADALRCAERAAELNPHSHATDQLLIGLSMTAMRRDPARFEADGLRELKGALDHSIERWGEWPGPLFQRASLRILEISFAGKSGRPPPDDAFRLALGDLERALELDPGFVDALYLLGITELFLPEGERPDAVRLEARAERVLAAFEAHGVSSHWSGRFAARYDDLARLEPRGDGFHARMALRFRDADVAAAPGDPVPARARAQTLLRTGRRTRSAETLAAAAEGFQAAAALGDARAWADAALAWLQAGDAGGAEPACAEAALAAAQSGRAAGADDPACRLLARRAGLELGRAEPGPGELPEPSAASRTAALALNDFAWPVAASASLARHEYERALRSATVACEHEPDQGAYLNTRGILEFRCGRSEAALATLSRSLTLNARAAPKGHPADLAFLALAAHAAGRTADAGRVLEQLRKVMGEPSWAGDAELAGFLAEAEAGIGEGAAPPAREGAGGAESGR